MEVNPYYFPYYTVMQNLYLRQGKLVRYLPRLGPVSCSLPPPLYLTVLGLNVDVDTFTLLNSRYQNLFLETLFFSQLYMITRIETQWNYFYDN